MIDAAQHLAAELRLDPAQVAGALALLKEDYPVWFIARYRREQTGNLSEERLAALDEAWRHASELEARRAVILNSVRAMEKLDEGLKAKIEAAKTRPELEDLYLSFSPKGKNNRAQLAANKGLAPLAEIIWAQEKTGGTAEETAMPFLNAEKGVKELADALAGARDILADRMGCDPACRAIARKVVREEGKLTARARDKVDLAKTKYAGFAEFSEGVAKLAPHRMQAVMRGEEEKKLHVQLEVPQEKIVENLKNHVVKNANALLHPELVLAIQESVERLLLPQMKAEIRAELKNHADENASELFARNLRALLLQPPLGRQAVLALLASGAGKHATLQAAALDAEGALLAHEELTPWKDDEAQKAAREKLAALFRTHPPHAVAIGSGTGGREAEDFARELVKDENLPAPLFIPVHESGAPAYGASKLGKHELPQAGPSLRACVFLGRRLQDPLAQLVKVDPKFIGVGQYQHDADARVLRRKLDEAVASCVARVGVDANLAGEELLAHVAGLGPKLAKVIVQKRQALGRFTSRVQLREAGGLGEKAFTLAAAFLRIRDGDEPLDATAIHPERYALVAKMAEAAGTDTKGLLGNHEAIRKLTPASFEGPEAGEATVRDILAELRNAGKDPRGAFAPPPSNPEVKTVEDLKEGQVLNGVVTNITAFGVFVDLGVRQDGLVHISELSHRFVRDPAARFAVGQAVKVKVLGVEPAKKRISLSIKALQAPPPPKGSRPPRRGEARRPARPVAEGAAPSQEGARPPRRPRRERPAAAPAGPAGVPPGAPAGARPGQSGRARSGERRSERDPRRDRMPRVSSTGKPLPDYSKFFVKGTKKRDKKKDDRKLPDMAGRQEVREVLQEQEKRKKPSLADLLKQAGVETTEE